MDGDFDIDYFDIAQMGRGIFRNRAFRFNPGP